MASLFGGSITLDSYLDFKVIVSDDQNAVRANLTTSGSLLQSSFSTHSKPKREFQAMVGYTNYVNVCLDGYMGCDVVFFEFFVKSLHLSLTHPQRLYGRQIFPWWPSCLRLRCQALFEIR